MSTDTPQPTLPLKARLERITPYFAGTRRGFLLMFIGSLVGAATEPLIPALMRKLFDQGFTHLDFPLWMVPVTIIGIFTVRGLSGLVAEYGLAWSANRGTQSMRTAMFNKLLTVHPSLFGQHTASSLTATVTYESAMGTAMIVGSVMTLVRDSLTLVALLGYLLYLNWKLTLFVGVLFPAIALVMRTVGKRLRRLTIENQDATNELAYVVEENVLAWRIVRLHGASGAQAKRFLKGSDSLRRLSIKATMAASLTTPLTQLIAACALSAVIVAALWQSSAHSATAGGFIAFITSMLMLLSPIKHLAEVSGPVTRGLAALERGIKLINDTQVEHGGSHDPGRATGQIEMRNVSLRYRDDLPPALANISLTLPVGQSVALVGPSGSGKTTIANLLPRFLDPSEGQILLDGRPLGDYSIAALRRQFALVSQDVVLFNDTLAANVALGAADAESDQRERVRNALRAANLLSFAEGLPQGLDTLIGHNGSQLSGGQRQRLAIARAVYKDAPILILDEATSALDSESERLVQQALDGLMRGRTTLVIAHRLSTIQAADRVVVIESGRIAEQGTHAELLASNGLFAHLHSLQFKTEVPSPASAGEG